MRPGGHPGSQNSNGCGVDMINLEDKTLEQAVEVIDDLLQILADSGLSVDALAAMFPRADDDMTDELRTLLEVLRRANTICNDYDDAWKAAEIARIESGG